MPNYVKKLEKIISLVELNLKKLSNSPEPESLHDYRTSFRRLQAAMACLPRSIREKMRLQRYISSRKKVFKSTTKIRDLDIISERLAAYDSIAASELIKKIQSRRRVQTSDLVRRAKRASEKSQPNVGGKTLDKANLSKRSGKVVARLRSQLIREIPLNATDPNSEEVHRFRKDAKNFRYTLEYVGMFPELEKTLRIWQKQLGETRDAQVTLEFLSKSENLEGLDEIVTNQTRSERENYDAFRQSVKDASILLQKENISRS